MKFGKHQCSKLHIPHTNYCPLAAQQEPYKKAYFLTKKCQRLFSGKGSGERTIRRKMTDRKSTGIKLNKSQPQPHLSLPQTIFCKTSIFDVLLLNSICQHVKSLNKCRVLVLAVHLGCDITELTEVVISELAEVAISQSFFKVVYVGPV